MNLLVNEPTRRPGQPLCQDPWGRGRTADLPIFRHIDNCRAWSPRRRRCPVHGNTYEVDAALGGRRVDPFDLSDLKVRSQSRDIRGAAIRHQIGRRVHPAAKPETEPWLEQLSVP